MPRKLSAIRQLSLQCESPPASATTRRSSLKKQQSEELKEDFGIRISLSAKALRTNNKTIKVAWEEDHVRSARRHSHSHEKDLLAQRFRQTYNDHELSKPSNKLNIFLAHGVSSNLDQDLDLEVLPSPRQPPKIMLPLHPETESKENSNLKNIFQKHLRKTSKLNSPGGSDTENSVNYHQQQQHQQPVVVVPIIERSTLTSCLTTNHPSNTPNMNLLKKPERPHTAAAQKRAMFQKRTNSAFQTISACPSPIPTTRPHTFRPPLTRASSVPTNNKPAECKIKNFRKKVKVSKRSKTLKDPEDESKRSSDVVTMVSLVSPSESEAEECEAPDEVPSPKKTTPATWKASNGGADENKNFSLRKTVKQVSFQHSSIHAVRSFSASFPARRASVGTNLLLDNAVKKLQKSLEKRGQQDEGLIDAKRRLLRTNDNGIDVVPLVEKSALGDENRIMSDHGEENDRKVETKENAGNGESVQVEDVESIKERKCWETYCRMAKSGLNVSFDTILRGMLTPTEYRLRRRFSLQCFAEGNEPAATEE